MSAAALDIVRRFERRRWVSTGLRYGVLLLITIVAPFLLSTSSTGILTLILLSVLGVTGLNLLQGVAGQLSIGNAAFMAIGSLSAGTFGQTVGLPFVLSVLLATAVATVVGVFVSLPALRVTGIFLLIGTVALQFIVGWSGMLYQNATASIAGFSPPSVVVSGHSAGLYGWYFIVAAAAWAASLLMRSIMSGRLGRIGRAWGAIKTGRTLAVGAGVNTARLVIGAFAISSALIGLQGALYAYYVGNASIDTFTVDLALQYVAMLIIGGEGRILGNFLGAGFVVGIPYFVGNYISNLNPATSSGRFLQTNLASIQELIYGLALIFFLLIEPRGLAGALARLWAWLTRHVIAAAGESARAPVQPQRARVVSEPAADRHEVFGPSERSGSATSPPINGIDRTLLDVAGLTVAYNGSALGVSDA
jgi:branched-chain amino acid transport system permease protein